MVVFQFFNSAKVLVGLGLLLTFLAEVTSNKESECLRLLETLPNGLMRVETVNCDFGCCGTFSDRYCCSEEETYGAQWRAWLIAGCVVGSALFVVLVGVGIFCIYKRVNRRKVNANRIPKSAGATDNYGPRNEAFSVLGRTRMQPMELSMQPMEFEANEGAKGDLQPRYSLCEQY